MTTDTPRTDELSAWIQNDARYKAPEQLPAVQAAYINKALQLAATLERDLSECRAALAELVACKDAPRTAPMVGIHDYACPCTRLGKKSGPCNCLGKAAEARIGQAWATARALTTKEPQP